MPVGFTPAKNIFQYAKKTETMTGATVLLLFITIDSHILI